MNESAKRLYARRRDAGLCVQCGEDADGKSKCVVCAAKDKACRDARTAARKQAGMCQNSGCPFAAMAGRTVCQSCSEKATAAKLDSYYERKQVGVCRYCGEDSDGKSRCEDCAAALSAYCAAWYAKQRQDGRCVNCNAAPAAAEHVLCVGCLGRKCATARIRWLLLKGAAFAAYGGPICAGCGEDEAEILEIDHIDGGGTKHRREIGRSRMYIWLKQNNYPDGYRVLCPTCNKKAHRGLALPNDATD